MMLDAVVTDWVAGGADTSTGCRLLCACPLAVLKYIGALATVTVPFPTL
jgi:hypothetical protein